MLLSTLPSKQLIAGGPLANCLGPSVVTMVITTLEVERSDISSQQVIPCPSTPLKMNVAVSGIVP